MEEKENSSIRNRRKSSFFQKQLHLVDEITNTEDNQISNNLNITRSSRTSDEEKMIMNHVYQIEKEISDWQTVRRKIKSKYQELEKNKHDTNVVTWNECENDLWPEDLEFLNNRPDYNDMTKKVENLIEKVTIMKHRSLRTKIKICNRITTASLQVHQIKQCLCDYLLHSDESENLYSIELNESENCSVESANI